MGCANIEEDVTEKIWILSGPITMLIDELLEAYGIRGFETRCKIVDELADRRNWDKCMKKFKRIVAELTWADDMAKRASQETGIEIVHFIPNSKFGGDDSFYYTSFDSKGMSDEEKMKEIERHVDAVDMAYKLLEDSEAERAFFEERFGIHRFGIRFHRRKKEKAKGTS